MFSICGEQMFKRKPKCEHAVVIKRRYDADVAATVTHVPWQVTTEIRRWMEEMGLPWQGFSDRFQPIHMVAGDQVSFNFTFRFDNKDHALMFKLAFA